jgi:hypothetical protein
MSTNEARVADSARLTWAEICERFPDEWVVLAGADWANETDFEFGSAEVIGHHKSCKDASPTMKAALERDQEVGFWTGPIRGSALRLFDEDLASRSHP